MKMNQIKYIKNEKKNELAYIMVIIFWYIYIQFSYFMVFKFVALDFYLIFHGMILDMYFSSKENLFIIFT